MRVRVCINGFGTIGKRIADAISRQPDMEVVGVSKTRPNYEAFVAIRRGFKLYVPKDKILEFENLGIKVAGTIEDMVSSSDVVIDATPAGTGAKYKDLYKSLGKPAIFQGGEKADVADVSFNTLCNYDKALGKRYVRVVSCNTTALLRVIGSLKRYFRIRKIFAVIVRRGADPKEIKRGPINAIVLDPPKVPSHHAIDVKTVLPDLDITTVAVAVPTTLMHTHIVRIEFEEPLSRSDVVRVLEKSPRIILVNSDRYGIRSTAELAEIARDMSRSRYDIPELVIWEDSITVTGSELILVQSVHQESIVIPENVDAVRAITRLTDNPEECMRITDENLGIKRWWI